MAVNYNDARFQEVNNQKAQALNEVNTMYNNMINSTDKFYQDQINASNEYANTQKELQQQKTDFAIEQINQNKEWAKQDYTKEQKGAYADYQKQSNAYGANAEALASRGLIGTGYAESSLVSMFNQYQNRVATARDSFNRAIVEYDAQIKDAQLQNSSKLAEIAYQALQTKLELSLEGFQYKNTLLQQHLNAKNETEDRYYNRWQNVLSQINTENALAEQRRQFDAQMAWEKEQAQQARIQIEKDSDGDGGNSGSKAGITYGIGVEPVVESSGGGRSFATTQDNAKKPKQSSAYNNAKSSTRAMYMSAPKNNKQAAENMLATYLAQGKITQAEAKQILKEIGIN